ncbi:MAG: hypothetical protein SGI99_02740 [Pseudomonadota bacterium]|nr:hypothetical protein [Pseudomonadota bacterium]
MTVANVAQGNARGLPPALQTAQAAIHIPEVQEMLRKLSEYKLGIFMPHMHDPDSGDFMALADEVMQVESGSEVSFQSRQEIVGQTDRFLPVGWIWHAGAPIPVASCEMVENESLDDEDRRIQHKMPKRS